MVGALFSQWSLGGAEGLRALGDQLSTGTDPASFRLEGRRWVFSDIVVSDVSQTPLRIRPAPFDLAQQRYISVTFVRNGHYELFDADRRFSFQAGDAGFMRGWDQVNAENTVSSRVAMVSIHEDRLAAHGVHVTDRIGAFHPSTRLRGPSLSFVLALMDEMPNAHAAHAITDTEPTATALTQLMAGLFLEHFGLRGDASTVSSSLVTRADALIARHATDQAFGPGELAAQLNVSLRQLQRVFSQRGSSPAEAIRARRLDVALEALRRVPVSPRSVSEIAAMAGFSSLKELRFALKLNYGVTPREFLAGQGN